MWEKIKELKYRFQVFFKTGYWNPKYVFLSLLTSEQVEQNRKLLWAGASRYADRGDSTYDRLYLAINDLETLKRLVNRKESESDE